MKWHHSKCAFCEKRDAGLEIEHFHAKANYGHDAFEWWNLFLSCRDCNGSKGEKEHDICLKPDEDDPEEYLWINPLFQTIEPKPGISEAEKKRAERTIQLYGLDRPELQREYLWYWRAIVHPNKVPSVQELLQSPDEVDWIAQYIQSHLDTVGRLTTPEEPYSLMVKSFIAYYYQGEANPKNNRTASSPNTDNIETQSKSSDAVAATSKPSG